MASLFVRLMAAFALVILVTVAVVFVVANLATTNEFQGFMFRGGMARTNQVAQDLAAYYSVRGSWNQVDQYLSAAAGQGMGSMMGPGPHGMGGMMSPSLLLADARGKVIASTVDGAQVGQSLSAAQLSAGIPINAGGQVVGTLVDTAGGAAPLDAQQQDLLQRTNLSILLAAIIGGAIALGLGFVLFYQITSPLHALAGAARQIAAGDLSARIQRPRNDEIGQVGQAFNSMADNLAQSESARRNMIADIAHELRNPLGAIQGQLEAMLDGVFPITPAEIASLHEDTLLLTRLVDDLRDLALADAGQLQVERRPTDLGELARRVAATFAAQTAESGVALNVEVAGVVQANVDPLRIEQVLRNLIGNALRYTPRGAGVRIQVACADGKSAIVRVVDTGSGISRDDLPHVFERFWRGDKSRARSAGGAGLGLAIAKQLILAHNGSIGVESEPGKGATFWFTVPQ